MNLLEVQNITHWSSNILGIFLNTLMITLALTERNKPLLFYSKMIVASSIVDFIFIFGSILCSESVVIEEGSILFVANGFLAKFSISNVQYWMTGVYVFILAIGNFIIPIEYYYRWHLIVIGQVLPTRKLIIIISTTGLVSFIGAVQFIYFFLFLARPEEETIKKFGYLVNNSIWLNSNGELPKFVANSLDNLPFFGELCSIVLLATCSYGIVIFLGLKIYKKLQSMRHVMSERTIRLQRSMTMILVIKAIAPFCLCTFPVLTAFVGIVFRINIPNLGIFLVIATSFIPLVSPLSTLILLPGYRRRLINIFLKLIGKQKAKPNLITISNGNFMPRFVRRPSVMHGVYSD